MNKEDEKSTKKKNHNFEIFISKILKQVSEHGNITLNAKQQLNSFLCILAKKISYISSELTIFSKKKTISEKEVRNSIKLILIDDILKNSLIEGEKAIETFEKNDIGGSRQNKAGIIFPPSITEKFLRNFGNSKLMITSLAPIYLAAVLEYLTFEILDLSNNYVNDDKRVRITIRDIEIAIRNDYELDKLFNKINVSFLGGGVIPFIHPSLIRKSKKKYFKRKENEKEKKHKYRLGTVAVRNIRKYQKMSDVLIISKSPFEKIIREIFKENKINDTDNNFKISKDVFIILQYFIEQFIVKLLYNANYLAIHSSRVKLLPSDIAFISYLTNNSKNPYKSFIVEENDVLSIDLQEQFDNNISFDSDSNRESIDEINSDI
jgi:histone H2A